MKTTIIALFTHILMLSNICTFSSYTPIPPPFHNYPHQTTCGDIIRNNTNSGDPGFRIQNTTVLLWNNDSEEIIFNPVFIFNSRKKHPKIHGFIDQFDLPKSNGLEVLHYNPKFQIICSPEIGTIPINESHRQPCTSEDVKKIGDFMFESSLEAEDPEANVYIAHRLHCAVLKRLEFLIPRLPNPTSACPWQYKPIIEKFHEKLRLLSSEAYTTSSEKRKEFVIQLFKIAQTADKAESELKPRS